MPDDDFTESQEFESPYVRVRGRVSRSNQVTWSPCLRIGKGPRTPPHPTDGPPVTTDVHIVAFLDYRGEVVRSAPTSPKFFAQDREWARFSARLAYHRDTQAVVLRLGDRELGRLDVPTDRPYFTLLHPSEDDFIDPDGVLHLHWAGHDTEHSMTFFVRYSHNDRDWSRPGVNLRLNDFYLDLRQMPGGKRCCAQVIATNGYRTSYVQTRHFEVPEKPLEVFLAETDGPILFVQGYSLEHGPVTGAGIGWLVDDQSIVHRGGSLDVRTLEPGMHRISVVIDDPRGQQRTEFLGAYDATSGRRTGGRGL